MTRPQARYLLGELVPSFAAVTQHTVVVPDTREWPRHERAAMAPAFQPSTDLIAPVRPHCRPLPVNLVPRVSDHDPVRVPLELAAAAPPRTPHRRPGSAIGAGFQAGGELPEAGLAELFAPLVWRRWLVLGCLIAGIVVAAVMALHQRAGVRGDRQAAVGSEAGSASRLAEARLGLGGAGRAAARAVISPSA